MKTVLICHAGAALDEEGLVHWLGSFSDLSAIVRIKEPQSRLLKRIQRELKRSGALGLLDVFAFRAYYVLRQRAADFAWERREVEKLCAAHPMRGTPEIFETESPNSSEVNALLRRIGPDLVIARCKTLLRRAIFEIPRYGTFVMHPGICPEYRNAHGCFWAMAEGDWANIGMTLLRVDEGVDTGPIFGQYRTTFDASQDSHFVIQSKAVIDNLGAVRAKLDEIAAGSTTALDVTGRRSRAWGQPRLSAYLKLRRAARAQQACNA